MLTNARAIRGFSRLLNGTALSVAAGAVVLAVASPAYAVGLNETPTGGVVAAGAATIDVPVAGTLNVTQSTDRAVIHWDTMNLGHDATWNVAQPGAGSLNINVATGAGTDPSEILGALNSNGRVILLDRNGVIFGPDSQVDVAGLVASSGSLDETEAMASGKLILSGDDLDGAVINRGTMTVAEGGLAALVAPYVQNSGVINAKLGQVILASGKKATIDLSGDGLFELAADEKLTKAIIRNTSSGKILAEGGNVLVTTATAVAALDNVINMRGIVDVSSVSVQGGKIVLSGGDATRVRVGGTLKSDGGTGGNVDVKGRSVRIQGDGKIMTGGGDITLQAERRVRVTNGFADAEGGNIRVETGNGFEGIGSSLLTTGTGTIYIQQVNPDLNTIQNAIDAISNSGTGTNTIDVAEGTWVENLYIGTDNLVLNGAKVGVFGDDPSRDGTGETVVEAADNALDTITVIANNVVIDGLTVTGGYDGIRGIFSPNLRVQNNIVHDTASSGIDLTGSPDSVVAHNLVFNNGWDGIKADGESNGISILFNKVENVARAGVSLIETASALVEGNDLSTLGMWGVYARQSDDLEVLLNTIQGVSYSEDDSKTGHGIYHVDSNNSHIADNAISEVAADGIHVASVFGDDAFGVSPIYIEGNVISYAGDDGIEVADSGRTTIEGNTVSFAGSDGIVVHGVSAFDFYYPEAEEEEPVEEEFSVKTVAPVDGEWAYSVNIIGNVVDTTGDDGIEVFDSGRTLIAYNNVSNAGVLGSLSSSSEESKELNVNSDDDGYGSDAIHVRNVLGGEPVYEQGKVSLFLELPGSPEGPTAVDVLGNFVNVDSQTGDFIGDTADDGVQVLYSGDTLIDGNRIANSGFGDGAVDEWGPDGIHVLGGELLPEPSESEDMFAYSTFFYVSGDSSVIVSNNYVDWTAGTGIEVEDSGRVEISDNAVYESDDDGIRVSNSHAYDDDGSYSVEVLRNIVDVSGDDGIEVIGSGRTHIDGNTVSRSGDDGIVVSGVYASDFIYPLYPEVYFASEDSEPDPYAGYWDYSVTITNNDVSSTGDDGIEVYNSARTLIADNDIRDVGFYVEDGGYDAPEFYGAVYDYDYDYYGSDAIHVRDVWAGKGYVPEGELITSVDIVSNAVNVDRETGEFLGETADDGVQVLYSGHTLVDNNLIANSGVAYDGEGDGAKIVCYGDCGGSGSVDVYGADGIHVMTGGLRSLAREFVSMDYPPYYPWTDVTVTNNVVTNSLDDGIAVDGASQVLVDANVVTNVGNDGIRVLGFEGYYGFDKVAGPQVSLLSEVSLPSWSAVITNNTVAQTSEEPSGADGIEVSGYDEIYVADNAVSNFAENGLFVSGPSNGYVTVEGNTFSDNDIGAHFQSGLIDLTGRGNRFERGRVGLRFAPIEMYYPTFYEVAIEFPEPLPSVYSYLELVDDDAPGVSPASENPPTNFGGTIGAQIFDGQSEYFVELDNGAFFEPGTPTWLNGLNSSYRMPGGEFLTPAASGGLLSAADLAYLEAGFYHYIDDSSLGRFWFGQQKPDDTAGVPPEDVFNTFGQFGGRSGNVVVTLLGLPRLPGQGGGGAGGGAGGAGGAGGGNITDFLNSITPAAGDEEGQSGEGAPTPEQLAAIETAAGGAGQSANCWSDATANAQNGGPTTISFSSSVGEETLQQEAACGNNPQQ